MRLVNRREFLTGLALSSLYACAAPQRLLKIPAPHEAWQDLGLVLSPVPGYLAIFDPLSQRFTTIEIANQKPHSFLQRPNAPRFGLVIDQEAKHVTLLDLLELKVLKTIEPSRGISFSGHGVFSADGSLLYLPEYYDEAGVEGKILVRDGRTLELIRELPSYGLRSHNVMLLQQGKVLLIGHQGTIGAAGEPKTGGCLVFLSAETGELIEKVIPADPILFMSHFDVDQEEKIVVSTQSFYSAAPNPDISLTTPLLFGKFGT